MHDVEGGSLSATIDNGRTLSCANYSLLTTLKQRSRAEEERREEILASSGVAFTTQRSVTITYKWCTYRMTQDIGTGDDGGQRLEARQSLRRGGMGCAGGRNGASLGARVDETNKGKNPHNIFHDSLTITVHGTDPETPHDKSTAQKGSFDLRDGNELCAYMDGYEGTITVF
nr:hypothetical protein Iba_chr07bCG8970 [Ipomoea batatas]